jgi:hypothetical protein
MMIAGAAPPLYGWPSSPPGARTHRRGAPMAALVSARPAMRPRVYEASVYQAPMAPTVGSIGAGARDDTR